MLHIGIDIVKSQTGKFLSGRALSQPDQETAGLVAAAQYAAPSPPGSKLIWGTGSGEFLTLFRVALFGHYRRGKHPLPSGCFCVTCTIGSKQRRESWQKP